MFRYLPEQASEHAHKIDWLNNLITDLSLFFTVAIVGTMIYFAIRYRRRDGVDHETPQIKHSETLEVLWTVVPTIISVYILYWGIVYFRDVRSFDKKAEVINVTGQKWKWDFTYKNGKKAGKEIVVPVNKPVRFVMTSNDVLHSFFVPAMRVKSDVVPGQSTYVSFKPVKVGDYHVFCTEYCGQEHWNMMAKLKVVSEAEYERWLADDSEEKLKASLDPVDLGKKLYTEKGCNACHSLDGSKVIGPSFLKLFGKEEELEDGSKSLVDEAYLRNSIYQPNSQIVKGFSANLMPVYEGQIDESELQGIIAFIRSLDGSAPVEAAPVAAKEEDLSALTPEERGKKIYNEKVCMSCHSLDGSKLVGPSFKGIYNRQGTLEGGASYTADDTYIKESILNPSAKVVQGYAPAMPPYQGQLNDDQLSDVIAFMKTLN